MELDYGMQVIILLLCMCVPTGVFTLCAIFHNRGCEQVEKNLETTPPGIIPLR